jgi:hypothetical protein
VKPIFQQRAAHFNTSVEIHDLRPNHFIIRKIPAGGGMDSGGG